jgi:hypothetical protein
MHYLMFFSWLVKSLVSKKESFIEDRVPGTSSATMFVNLFAKISNFCAACKFFLKHIKKGEKFTEHKVSFLFGSYHVFDGVPTLRAENDKMISDREKVIT